MRTIGFLRKGGSVNRKHVSPKKQPTRRVTRLAKTRTPRTIVRIATIEGKIHTARGHRVILDCDLAELYGVSTKVLNQAAKRNAERFPDEFLFQLSEEEAVSLRSQFVTLNELAGHSHRGKHRKYLPHAFTEHGALMAANVLRSPRAIQMSVHIVQTFVRLQRVAASIEALALKVEELEKLGGENREQIKQIVAAIRQLMTPPERPKREIGYHAIRAAAT